MKLTKVSPGEIAKLSLEFPNIPHEYFEYLRHIGWGECASGRMIYSGPVSPKEVYGKEFNQGHIILLGDDFQGYCFGYNIEDSTYGELDPLGNWEPWSSIDGLRSYVEA
jgi:hypothetical protein